ncbi:ring finger domain-containing protein [Gigaspora margarita]|uniref:Ring finger domain-containing protein n=1 Tax=Gigaspora margarita TaxID=4874 RepID=A0A8H3X9D6_GIGMA|nr:ring finger domain-containing protein [Gigaspora margarita]
MCSQRFCETIDTVTGYESDIDEDVKGIATNNIFKRNEQKILCTICYDEDSKEFVRITSKCNHKDSVCHRCVNANIEASIQQCNTDITCIVSGCDKIMDYQDVKRLTTNETFKRFFFLKNIIKFVSNAQLKIYIPAFRWCEGCGSGQIHSGKDKNPQIICEKCFQISCYTHKIQWHYGQTCEEYDKSLRY